MRKELEAQRKCILIVDDDLLMSKLLESSLKADYDLIIKHDGEEALAFMQNESVPDLIITDIEMPKMNGRVFIRQVRTFPNRNKIPFIIISGVDSNSIKKSFIKIGVKDYLIKPFNVEELLASIRKALSVE